MAESHRQTAGQGRMMNQEDSGDADSLGHHTITQNHTNVPSDGHVTDVESQDGETEFSNYGSSASSFLSTIRSGAYDFFYENGRRYHGHGGGRYLLPSDDIELDRETIKHYMWLMMQEDLLHLSPISAHPLRILDLGTGSGIWAMQVADKYPSAEVIGMDISPVQPNWVPPNLNYEVDDLEQEWLYKPDSFDLVYVRCMFMGIRDWPAMLEQAYQCTRPGGYVELSELALRPMSATSDRPSAPTITQWFDIQGDMMRAQGIEIAIARRFKQMLMDAGFEDVKEEIREMPWGTWPADPKLKAIGFWHLEQLKQGLQGIAMASMTRAGWSPEQVEIFVAQLRHEMNDKKYHTMDHAYIVYGRKPVR